MSVIIQTQNNNSEITIAFANCACLKALQDHNRLRGILINRSNIPTPKGPTYSLVFVSSNHILHHYIAASRNTLMNTRSTNHNLTDFIEIYGDINFSQGGNKITVIIQPTIEQPNPIHISTDTDFIRHCRFHVINPKHIPNSIYWYYDTEQ